MKKSPLLIAEYGYTKYEPAHSYRAFLSAANKGFKAMRFSVRFTKDDYPIASLKPQLIINDTSFYINKYTYQELKALDLFLIPNELSCQFSDYLIICQKYQIKPFIEINRATSERQIDILIQQLHQFNLIQETKFVSPKLSNLIYLRGLSFDYDLQLLVDGYSDFAFLQCCKYHIDLYIKTIGFSKAINQDIVDLFHDHNLKVACGPINNSLTLSSYKKINVDYIYSGELY